MKRRQLQLSWLGAEESEYDAVRTCMRVLGEHSGLNDLQTPVGNRRGYARRFAWLSFYMDCTSEFIGGRDGRCELQRASNILGLGCWYSPTATGSKTTFPNVRKQTANMRGHSQNHEPPQTPPRASASLPPLAIPSSHSPRCQHLRFGVYLVIKLIYLVGQGEKKAICWSRNATPLGARRPFAHGACKAVEQHRRGHWPTVDRTPC
ncbi:hypothetical protein J3F83DRAFT_725495 [Trichoderma novae-zelandiae]